MNIKKPKKLIIVNILDILRKYTDEDHRLSQKDIADILKNEYDMNVDRKAIKRNLVSLMEYGYEIEYSEAIRMSPVIDPETKKPVTDPETGNPKLVENCIMSDFYLVRDFTDGELRLLIDSLLFSKHIPYSQCKELVEKLERLSNTYFKSRTKHIRTMPVTSPKNAQLFLTIETLDEAITKHRKVSFLYNEYGTDKKMHPKLNADGKPKRYVINPYQIAAASGKYYLICNYDKYDDISNYRLDRITDIQIIDEPAKPIQSIKGHKTGLDLPRHMAEHIYMFTGDSANVSFAFKKYILNEIIDWFGNDINFTSETEDEITATVRVNLLAMRKWALQYALHARILSPASLADQVREDISEAAENYSR